MIEEEVENDEQVLFGDITAEVEEQLFDVEVVPEHTAELRKELDNMNTGKQFLAGCSQQKRNHASVFKRVRANMAPHEEISIDQSRLRSDRRGLASHYKLAIKYHQQFIDKVPNLAEGRRLLCEKWRADFEAAHKAIIAEIYEYLVETSSLISKFNATLENEMQDVQQQLKSQEQQFLKHIP